jgi:hypothetical protein
VCGVKLVRCRHVHDLDGVVRAQGLNGIKGFRAELGCEARARFGARVRAGDELHARIGAEGGRHERERAPQPCHSKTQLRHTDFWYHPKYLGD